MPKNCVQIIFYNETCKEFRKNQFFSNIFTFLSVICQNFEDNLRILGNFGKFSRKNSKIYGFRPYIFKKLHFFFNKDYSFLHLRILANFGKFSRKNSKTYGFRRYVFKKLHFFCIL